MEANHWDGVFYWKTQVWKGQQRGEQLFVVLSVELFVPLLRCGHKTGSKDCNWQAGAIKHEHEICLSFPEIGATISLKTPTQNPRGSF